VTADLQAWFTFYNGREDMEAGIKEGKGILQMHHLKVHAPAGLVIQEEVTAFAANFVGLLLGCTKPVLMGLCPSTAHRYV
jgi:hypothetical protein